MNNSTLKTVLVHIPYPLHEDADTAPQVRPRKMIGAFRDLGPEIIVVSGNARERRVMIREIQSKIQSGTLHVDLVYSESAGWPNAFSEGQKTSFHPLLDTRFLKFMRRQGTPIHLFYRDAYHRTPEFTQVAWYRKLFRRFLVLLAKRDLREYNSYVSVLYLPSLGMKREIPEYRGAVSSLPPGAAIRDLEKPLSATSRELSLLYVGGMGDHYALHDFFAAVASTAGVRMTVCTRETDWARVQSEYSKYLSDNIQIVHHSANQLNDLYARADATVLAFEPHPYREFAVPVKLFEYIGAGKPIIATHGTFGGDYVSSHSLGWTVDYGVDYFRVLLMKIASEIDRPEAVEKCEQVRLHALRTTWNARARQVLDAAASRKFSLPEAF